MRCLVLSLPSGIVAGQQDGAVRVWTAAADAQWTHDDEQTGPGVTRIIAGRARGLRLRAPTGSRTRPTSDRVRESVFSTLASWLGTTDVPPDEALAGIGFLDLYAGSGAVGLEAASRGADRVVLVENHPATARLIEGNASALRESGVTAAIEVVRQDAERFLTGPGPRAFDVVWLDPPYALTNADLEALLGGVTDRLAEDGLVAVERSARGEAFAWPEALAVRWRKDYGETAVHYARRTPEPDQIG